jgi:peptidoglycan pentaglycine glycine transferase (the first glycine)
MAVVNMLTLTPRIITDRDTWNHALATLPNAHVLQTWEWGEFKQETTGWKPQRITFYQGETLVAMASIGIRNIGPLRVMYAPKGPALDAENPALVAAVLDHLQGLARQHRAIWLKIDPDILAAQGLPDTEEDTPYLPGQAFMRTLTERGWRFSENQVQFRNTILLDLTQSEDELLMQMSGNTRRKVRTAEKKDVRIRPAGLDELNTLYALYQDTSARDGFIIRPLDYYKRAWQAFLEAGLAHALIAEVDGQPIAHVILFHFGKTCWYFYGASSNEERQRMPNYALQWEAMKWAKAQGYTAYDMWGAPDVFDKSDSMWGVYEFKRGFRGVVTRYVGAWDYAPYPWLYRLYTELMPKLIAWMRRRA